MKTGQTEQPELHWLSHAILTYGQNNPIWPSMPKNSLDWWLEINAIMETMLKYPWQNGVFSLKYIRATIEKQRAPASGPKNAWISKDKIIFRALSPTSNIALLYASWLSQSPTSTYWTYITTIRRIIAGRGGSHNTTQWIRKWGCIHTSAF